MSKLLRSGRKSVSHDAMVSYALLKDACMPWLYQLWIRPLLTVALGRLNPKNGPSGTS
ncbi:unnamed protein product [Periconia digitata]|uniref:Uncharacterized protein n=1 Tax=Periconia digitata TaxID=1303443 RepID=A0A9W4XFW3_9PLEO|nr:unnamed protein product [Periconia digitata]